MRHGYSLEPPSALAGIIDQRGLFAIRFGFQSVLTHHASQAGTRDAEDSAGPSLVAFHRPQNVDDMAPFHFCQAQ